MRALQCHQTGGFDALAIEDVPDPSPGSGEVLVAVAAASVNFVDTLVVAGRYQIPFAPPFIPGSDFAGTVAAVGPDVTGFAVGDRVHGMSRLGAFAELVAVPEGAVRKTPADIAAEVACTLGSSARTAYDALVSVGRVKPDEDVVVLGASGAVGTAAIAIAKALGARVVACASPDKLGLCVEMGADETIDYTKGDLKDELKRVCDGGADLVLDMVGGPASEEALRATGFGGRFVVVGFASGAVPKVPLNLVLLKGSAILGYEIADFERYRATEAEANRTALEQMAVDSRYRPAIANRFQLEDAAQAMRIVAGRDKAGATILRMDVA
ncbi:NADPH:quinone oxidoreductase family protein [Nitriliruptor alkaliphilus]|uniref:NADPH:quinone oxidoreductase family protein n=1 Tax=Nitriliruptor alkaliphilus TaxID=427918 RepID=UPI0009F8757A|nr:NADPH:quinone oxidoreductase family protein [Nitriliruptor alkaliphilus]